MADAALTGDGVATVAVPRASPHVVVRLSAPEIVPLPRSAQLEEVHTARQRWYEYTGPIRQEATLARRELERRLGGEEERAETALNQVDNARRSLGGAPRLWLPCAVPLVP